MDERYLMHRLRSTSLAGMVGAISLGCWTLFQFFIKNIFRWDLFIILLIMGLVKMVSMAVLRRMN
ncbi:hypothetical protein JW835_12310 [bacterium]|nr:hypothetical protein [bacterium]